MPIHSIEARRDFVERAKQRELHNWLKTTPPASHGAKQYLQERFGVRQVISFTPVPAFGLELDETNGAPLNQERGAEPTGVGIQTQD